ncbi:MAG: hypothetical protein H7Y38_11005 [Armatimonadetes bacterium]|nr:hypothetical protein [Armatimonadota bacterium]
MNALQWLFGALLAGSVAYTVLGYRHKYGALSGKSRLFRTVGLVLMDLLLLTVLMFFSTDWDAMLYKVGVSTEDSAARVLLSKGLYFATWMLLSVLTVGCAALDSLENFSVYRRQRREALDQMVQETIAASVARRTAGQSDMPTSTP